MIGSPGRTDDERLLGRLRDLFLVDVDSLMAGCSGGRYAELLSSYADDLQDALRSARARMEELVREAAGGADPLALVELSSEVRARDGGRELVSRVTTRLEGRALACRQLARLDDLTGQLLPQLFEVDRRRASLGTGP